MGRLLMLTLVPSALFVGMAWALGLVPMPQWSSRGGRRAQRETDRAHAAAVRSVLTGADQLTRVAADLQRLERDRQRIRADDRMPARYQRLTAVEQAYDATLVDACGMLALPPPHPPLDAAQRLEIEAQLALRGVHW